MHQTNNGAGRPLAARRGNTAVWALAAIAGLVTMAWSLYEAGIHYDERTARIVEVTDALKESPEGILLWNTLADAVIAKHGEEDWRRAIASWAAMAPGVLVKRGGEALLAHRVGVRLRGNGRTSPESRDAWEMAEESMERFLAERPALARYYHYHSLGVVRESLGNAEGAWEAFALERETAEHEAPSAGLALAMQWLANYADRHKKPDTRRWAYERLLSTLDEVGELRRRNSVITWPSAAEHAKDRGEPAMAGAFLDRMETTLRRSTATQSRGYSWQRLAELRSSVGDAEGRARAYAAWSERLVTALADAAPGTRVNAWRDLAISAATLGETPAAASGAEEIEAILNAAQDSPAKSTELYNIACIRALSGETQMALDAWERALALIDRLDTTDVDLRSTLWVAPYFPDEDTDLDNIREEARFAQGMLRLVKRNVFSVSDARRIAVAAKYTLVLGDREEAAALLERTVEMGWNSLNTRGESMFDPAVDPILGPFAREPRFDALRAKIEENHPTSPRG